MQEDLTAVEADRRRSLLLLGIALAAAAAGLLWAKWLPYTHKVEGIAGSHAWPGTSLLASTQENPFVRAWTFTWTYTQAVWQALLVALVISACVDVLVPRKWLLRVLGRRTPLGGSVAGGLASLPGMMCTCCTAPLTVTMRRAGVPTSAALAFWLGNPVLNPAVLIFLALLAPWQWAAVRVVLGVVLVIGVSALLGSWAARRSERLVGAGSPVALQRLPSAVRIGAPGAGAGTGSTPERTAEITAEGAAEGSAEGASSASGPGQLVGRVLRSFLRLSVVLVPEYLIVVFAVGLVGRPLGQLLGQGGAVAILVAAVVGVVLVLPTGGEVPILLGLAAAGASAGVLGALLIALPALSLPSAIMVGRALSWRVTAMTALATVAVAVAAGGLLTVFG